MSRFERELDDAWAALEKSLGRTPTLAEGDHLEGELFQAWIGQRRFDDLIRHLHEAYELEGGHVDCVTLGKALRDAGQVDAVHTLFRGLIRSRTRAFWRSWPEAETGVLGHMRDAARYFASAMEAYAEYHHNLWALKLTNAQAELKAEMLRFQARERPSAPARKRAGVSDKRFWNLIDTARKHAGSAGQFAEALSAQLATCAPEDIGTFDRLLWDRLGRLNHRDLWAVAHLARGGCSDDSFDYFRAWIVAQGRAAFDAACRGPADLLPYCDDSWDLQCEELLSAADEAYRTATGRSLERSPRGSAPLQGTPWSETDLESRYPDVFRWFAAR